MFSGQGVWFLRLLFGSGFRVQGVPGLGFLGSVSGFRVPGSGFRVLCFLFSAYI